MADYVPIAYSVCSEHGFRSEGPEGSLCAGGHRFYDRNGRELRRVSMVSHLGKPIG